MATEAKDISPVRANEIDTLSINTIRTLAMDAVQQAQSGHPGTPIGRAHRRAPRVRRVRARQGFTEAVRFHRRASG